MKRLFVFWFLALAPLSARAQWVQTNGPYGGWVFCIDTLGSNIFVGTKGGVFESTDSGSSWLKRSNGLPTAYVQAFATQGSIVFAGTYGAGVFRSLDSGKSWVSSSVGLPSDFTVISMGSSSGALYIPLGALSFVSIDEGEHWTELDTNLTRISQPQAVLTIDTVTYLAGTWITQTTDNGHIWNVVAVPPSDSEWNIKSMANIGSILFAVRQFREGILRSTDNGTTWNSLPLSIAASSINSLTSWNGFLLGIAGTVIYRSTDSGNTWTILSTGLPSVVELTSLASIGSILFASSTFGMFRSTNDGEAWSACSNGIPLSFVTTIATADDTIFAGTHQGFFRSTDNGMNWFSPLNALQDDYVETILDNDGTLWAGIHGDVGEPTLFQSTDGGDIWNPDTVINGNNFTALDRVGTDIFAIGSPDITAESGFFQSTNNGNDWTSILIQSGGTTGGFYFPATVKSFLNINSTFYAATNTGLFYTYDLNAGWDPMYYYVNPGGSYDEFAGVYLLGLMGNVGWLSSLEQPPYKTCEIFYCDDMGNWHPVGDTSVPYRGIVTAFAAYGTNLFVTTDSDGIFLTTDTGASWINENLGLGDTNVISLAIQGDELLAGTATSGVWRRPLAEMIPFSSVAENASAPDTISVFPNPASSVITISSSDLNGTISARVLSETGSEIWRRSVAASGHPFQLDLSGVPNGSYWLELRSNSISKIAKVLLQR